jgi:hypothetical protein
MAAKTDPLKLVAGKRPTIASLPLCMDPEAYSEGGQAKAALDEAEARLSGLNARLRALDDGEIENEINGLEENQRRTRAEDARLRVLKSRWSNSPVVKLRAEVEDQEKIVDDARKRMAAAEKAIEKATVEFKMRAVPNKVVRRLMGEHPPTEEQKEAWEKEMEGESLPQAVINRGLSYNTDTYPPALIATCLIHPKMTADEVAEMIWDSDNWNEQEKSALFQLALQANQAVPLAR